MKEDQRNLAMAAWRKLFIEPVSVNEAENRYHTLLRAADAMEKATLISSDEWKRLVQEAGTALARSPDRIVGRGWF